LKKDYKFYIKLFLSMFYLSAFTFGGGYVIISFMRKKFVEDYKWIDEKEMLDITAISQSSPGSIAINASVMLGYRFAGIPGLLLSVLGTTLPPLIILSVVSVFYAAFKENEIINAILKGMNAGIAAVVIDATISIGKTITKEKSLFSYLIMILSFLSVFVFQVDVKIIILVCGLSGFAKMFFFKRKENH